MTIGDNDDAFILSSSLRKCLQSGKTDNFPFPYSLRRPVAGRGAEIRGVAVTVESPCYPRIPKA